MEVNFSIKMRLFKQSEINLNTEWRNIDEHCKKMLQIFYTLGMPTTACCEGHSNQDGDFYVMFDVCVTDKSIRNFLEKLMKYAISIGPANAFENEAVLINFRLSVHKYMRFSPKDMVCHENWMITIPGDYMANHCYSEKISELIENAYNITNE